MTGFNASECRTSLQWASQETRNAIVVSIVSITLVLLVLAVSAVSQTSQAAASADANDSNLPAIHGLGSTHFLATFRDAHDIVDSGILESGGNISTQENLNAGSISGQTSAVPGVGVQGFNLTTNGSTSQDASFSSGIHGVDGSTNSPAGVGVFGSSTANVGDPIGVFGYTSSTDRGIGVRGHSNATTGIGLGVLGESNSRNGTGVIGVNGSPSGFSPIGMFGFVLSADGGIGVLGRAWSKTGFGSGIRGESLSPNGVGGLFENKAGGDIIYGMNAGVTKFRVDGQGKVYADGGFQPDGADFAESMPVAGSREKYKPGDLLAVDATARQRLTLAQQPYSTLVAGIYSTKPGVLGSMRSAQDQVSNEEVPLAVVGIVPCKVTTENGPIQIGDLLVSSSTPGYAMKGTDRNRMLGAVIGKALEPLQKDTGVVQVLITLQ